MELRGNRDSRRLLAPGLAQRQTAAILHPSPVGIVAKTAGTCDALVEVVCRDTAHFTELLQERIQNVEGVVATEPFFVLEIHKMAYGWGVGEVATTREVSAG